MQCLSSFKRLGGGLALAIFVLFSSNGLAAPPKPAKEQAKVAPTSAGEAGRQYVGSQTCKACHEKIYDDFMASPHWLTTKETRMTHGAQGCESCHGPGSAHVAGGGDPSKIFRFTTARPDEISRRCLGCHQAGVEQRQFIRSTHNESGIACTSCHSIHGTHLEYLLRSKEPDLCFSCHAEQRADFQKPFRHRVLEGLVRCSDCHNEHGTRAERQVRSMPDASLVCLKCHSGKRGPFVFEHNAESTEGCMVCHSPHGSTNPRMLITARVNSLCLQCHAAPAGTHNQNSKSQDCTLCHSQIHGSNLSDLFFK